MFTSQKSNYQKDHCVLEPGHRGICGIRHNHRGKLFSLVNTRPCSVALDPIEKKPLYHFYPGTRIYSIGTVGCNMRCDFCQNWTISQTPKGSRYDLEDVVKKLQAINLTPEKAVANTLRNGCNSIAYTYNEPTVFADFIFDTARLAHSKNVKNVLVTNGYQSRESILKLSPFIDACNIDLKSFSNGFYSKLTGVRLKPILRNIKLWVELGVWIEVTTLLIPGENDGEDELNEIAKYLADIDVNIVWHLSAYYDAFRMNGKGVTPLKTLKRAHQIGKKYGLKYIYLGNVSSKSHSTTYCGGCQKSMVERGHWGRGGKIGSNMNVSSGTCKKCNMKIPGVWTDECVNLLRNVPRNDNERQTIIERLTAVKMHDPMDVDVERGCVKILYASQTGVCEEYAKKLKNFAQVNIPNCDKLYNIEVVDLEEYDEKGLGQEDYVVIVTSTFFYGRIPRNGERFLEHVRGIAKRANPQIDFLKNPEMRVDRIQNGPFQKIKGYVVFGIGSTGTRPEHLETYQVIAKEIDRLFDFLGARRICRMGEGNKRKEFLKTLDQWMPVLWKAINSMK